MDFALVPGTMVFRNPLFQSELTTDASCRRIFDCFGVGDLCLGDGRNGLTGTAETLRRMEYF